MGDGGRKEGKQKEHRHCSRSEQHIMSGTSWCLLCLFATQFSSLSHYTRTKKREPKQLVWRPSSLARARVRVCVCPSVCNQACVCGGVCNATSSRLPSFRSVLQCAPKINSWSCTEVRGRHARSPRSGSLAGHALTQLRVRLSASAATGLAGNKLQKIRFIIKKKYDYNDTTNRREG